MMPLSSARYIKLARCFSSEQIFRSHLTITTRLFIAFFCNLCVYLRALLHIPPILHLPATPPPPLSTPSMQPSSSSSTYPYASSKNIDPQRSLYWDTVMGKPSHSEKVPHKSGSSSSSSGQSSSSYRSSSGSKSHEVFKCTEEGCNQVFRHRSSRSRHKKNHHGHGKS